MITSMFSLHDRTSSLWGVRWYPRDCLRDATVRVES